MTALVLLAWGSALGGSETPVKVLAVIGAAVLGGLGLGLLVRPLIKALRAQNVPYWPLRGVRLGGALVAGWLVALWLFGAGGGGIGGPGGGWFGGGRDRGKSNGTPTTGPVVKKDQKGP